MKKIMEKLDVALSRQHGNQVRTNNHRHVLIVFSDHKLCVLCTRTAIKSVKNITHQENYIVQSRESENIQSTIVPVIGEIM